MRLKEKTMKENKLLALRLANILVKNYQYHFVGGINEKDCFWLIGSKSFTYRLIKIETETLDELKDKYIHKKIEEKYKQALPLLSIHISEKPTEIHKSEFYIFWQTGVNERVPEEINKEYQDFYKAFSPMLEVGKESNKLQAKLKKKKSSDLLYDLLKNPKNYLITFCSALVCIFIYICSLLIDSDPKNRIEVAIVVGGYYKAMIIVMDEYCRLFTHGFVHVDFEHLLMNMWTLISLGIYLEPAIGRKRYAITLFGSILSGGLCCFFTMGNQVVYGISGGLYGIATMFVLLLQKNKVLKKIEDKIYIWLVIAVNVYISFLPGVSLAGHFGGFLWGLLFGSRYLYKDSKIVQNGVIITGVCLFLLMVLLIPKAYSLDWIFPKSDIEIISLYEKIGLKSYSKQIEVKMTKYYGGLR